MRRFISIITIIALTLLPVSIAERDSDLVYFEPTITGKLDTTPSEWLSSGKTRALLTLLIALDLQIELGMDDALLDVSQESFVGSDNSDLMVNVYFHGTDGKDYMVYHSTSPALTAYSVSDSISDDVAELVLEGVWSDGVYENSLFDLYEVTNELGKILQ